ncbi:hypothetical protein [Nocardioides iriomotensis]|uniref:DUF4145 domain-containing protein n=1 Tax=Nocardioides iriomotensis TaxID=715784 RepID=A0A4Q5J6S9_9ACTN|nr:hypothetical protein [Nocardioides iriomotensis]RYU14350.1 hypothetical protein ETU37_03875 [Nocardioides iriomotensis]
MSLSGQPGKRLRSWPAWSNWTWVKCRSSSICSRSSLTASKRWRCVFESGAYFAVVVLCGSTLEGLLYEVAKSHPAEYNRAKAAPTHDGKVRSFPEWTLNDLLQCSRELGLLGEDVTKFGHAVREFRNYIHPQQQVRENFRPRKVTAQVARQVLRAAIDDLGTHTLRADPYWVCPYWRSTAPAPRLPDQPMSGRP